jgi:hypothetical protein
VISPAEPIAGRPALHLAKPGTELEMVISDDKTNIVAILIPAPIHMHQIEHLYAIGDGVFVENDELAQVWGLWAVLCDPTWARVQLKQASQRPHGAKFFFVS